MTNWRTIAARARNYAKKIEEPSYSSKKVDIMDINASGALTQAYNYCGSKASVHTYNGGRQVIDTYHADGARNHFDSEGENNPGDNDMDRDVFDYMSNLNESNNINNMRNTIRVNEATFKRIIAESVKGVLSEISPELKAAAAMTAAKRASGYTAGSPKFRKYIGQSDRFANSAADDFQHQNPAMTDVFFNPFNRSFSAQFNGQDSNGNTIEYYGDNNRLSPGKGGQFVGVDPRNNIYGTYAQYPESQVASNFSNRDLNRYERFQDQCRDANQRLRGYQPKD